MQGWIDLTKQQVRALEADLQLRNHRPMPERLPALIADHPAVNAHGPMIQTPAMMNLKAAQARNESKGVLVEGINVELTSILAVYVLKFCTAPQPKTCVNLIFRSVTVEPVSSPRRHEVT